MTRPASFVDVSPVEVAAVASLLGDVARASMVSVLLDGRARTAGELAVAAGVTPQTASSHLAKLIEGDLISVIPQGRHRYHRLASPDAAHALEALSMLAASPARKQRTPGPKVAKGVIVEEHQSFRVAQEGEGRLACLGVVVPGPRRSGRPACRWCLDWSERRPHLAGAVGAQLTSRSLEAGWVRRLEGSRAVHVTPAGEQVFADVLGLRLRDMAHAA